MRLGSNYARIRGGAGDMFLARAGRVVMTLWIIVVFSFLAFSTLLVIYYSFSPTSDLSFPPRGITTQWYVKAFSFTQFTKSLRVSLLVAATATLCSLLIGVPASYGLARYRFRGRLMINSFFLSPLMIPSSVLGIGLLLFYTGMITKWIGYRVTGTYLGLIVPHTVITIPWVVRTVLPTLLASRTDIEEAALNLGATPLQAFLLITVPQIKSALVAGGIFAYVVSFGNVELSLFLTGPDVLTLPVSIMTYVEFNPDPSAAAISAIVALATATAVYATDRLIGIGRVM